MRDFCQSKLIKQKEHGVHGIHAPYLIVHPWWLRWAFNQPVSLSGYCSNARTIRWFRPHNNALDIDRQRTWVKDESFCVLFSKRTADSPMNMHGASHRHHSNLHRCIWIHHLVSSVHLDTVTGLTPWRLAEFSKNVRQWHGNEISRNISFPVLYRT